MTTTPANNIEGAQVWNPSVGIYFKPASGQRESYGGVIGALQDNIAFQGGESKAYPHNFAGIISAIQDLTFTQEPAPPSPPGVKPPDGNVIIDDEGNPEWIWITEPKDGDLWFDTRQGRMFIAIDGEYYQTNGADGLAQVTDAQEPQTPVIGQFWWDISTNSLYIFDGFWLDPDGEVKGTHEPGYTPIWRLVTSGNGTTGGTQTTGTLPLLNADTTSVQNASILPELPSMYVQSDFNNWVFDALGALDTNGVDNSAASVVVVGTTPPENPKSGDLWYDSVGLDLSVWYEDEDSSQWVPTATSYSYDDEITALSTRIAIEELSRNQAITALQDELNVVKQSDVSGLQFIEQKVQALEGIVNTQPSVDLTGYTTATDLNDAVSNITSTINIVRDSIPSSAAYATPSQLTNLADQISQIPTADQVQSAITSALPNVTAFVTQDDINSSIDNITTEYLPRTGGTLTGSFVVEKTDTAKPAFDFSTNKWNGRSSHKYLTHSMDGSTAYAEFGTNERPWEYEWSFNSNEDFCWVYSDTNKVFSITKDGPACSQLYIGDIMEDNTNGRQIANKIDVKDRLIKYQTAFAGLRSGVTNATNFDELKANILSALASV